jgi:hypothetical protein
VGSNQQNYTLEGAGRIIQSLIPKAEILDMGANTDFRNYRVDFTKIRKLLSFSTRWSLKEGINQVIAALESGEVRDYRNPMYNNAKFLSEENNSGLMRPENSWAQELIKQEVESARRPVVVAAH